MLADEDALQRRPYSRISHWDLKIGLLLLICAIAIYLDIILIKKGIKKENTKDDRAFISYVNSLNSYWK